MQEEMHDEKQRAVAAIHQDHRPSTEEQGADNRCDRCDEQRLEQGKLVTPVVTDTLSLLFSPAFPCLPQKYAAVLPGNALIVRSHLHHRGHSFVPAMVRTIVLRA